MSTALCDEVDEDMPRVLDGTAAPELLSHIEDCDRCRDACHDARCVLDLVLQAGKGFEPAAGLDGFLLGALDRRPASPDLAQHGAPAAASPIANSAGVYDESTLPSAPAVSPGSSATDAPSVASATASSRAPEASSPLSPAPSKPAAMPGHLVIPLPSRRRLAIGAGLASLVAMAAGGVLMLKNHSSGSLLPSLSGEAWSGEVKSLARSATPGAPGAGGLQRCDSTGAACTELHVGDPIPVGSLLRTDRTTRAQLHLADGSEFILDHNSEVALREGESRSARVIKGSLVADIAHLEHGPNARLALPGGKLEVLGTRFAVDAGADRSRVSVSRGIVQLTDDRGGTEKVLAGEEGRLVLGSTVTVAPSPSIAEGFAWSERVQQPRAEPGETKPDESADLRGLGELRGRKPGQTDEKGGAVRLARHDVKVRIVDNVARTEIDESFQNDSGEELEGIFRFPLPPDAQIERLALEVNGKLEEGAFVEKEKGAAIWRGVIQNAVPKSPKPVEEIIWVPGPWRDPALLEWKRGGRFELRIFPIPARGSRRIILAYTQTVAPVGGVRRYTYPLPHDGRGAGAIENFRVDAQVLGHDKSQGVRATGYTLASAPGTGEGERLTMAESKFTPSGDLNLEYTLPDAKSELSTWAYQTPQGDESPYVALALRPKLPRRREEQASEQVIVVDTSRSMVGERLGRARAVVRAMVKEVGDKDHVQVLACDSECIAWPAGSSEGGAEASANADKFLTGITPDGASDLSSMVRQARAAGEKTKGDRTLRIVYVGDGAASAGPTKPDHLTAEIKRGLGTSGASVHAVAIGADADTGLLGALARGGGGVLVPYVPGQRASEVALAAENAVNGVSLREAELVLPAGFVTVAPSTLDTIRAGSETVIVGRMTSKEIEGEAVLRGKVGGEAFEQKYPIKVIATTEAGNGFVPRLYAAGRIADLERSGGEGSKTAMVELSKKFSVASRHTSLLVLESEAMMTAFGLKRASTPLWTGESAATGTTTRSAGDSGDAEAAQDDEGAKSGLAGLTGTGFGGGGKGAMHARMADAADPFASAPAPDTGVSQAAAGPRGATAGAAAPAGIPPAAMAAPTMPPPPPRPIVAKEEAEKKKDVAADKPSPSKAPRRPPPRDFDEMPRQRMVAMKKVWDRKGTFIADLGAWHDRDGARIIAAEGATAAKPDSRQATKDLFALYEQHGRMDRAAEIAQKWATRDALDPEALLARADVAARGGDRKLAIRILGSVVDIRPDDGVLQNRLAALYEQMGDRGRACAHRVTLAEQKADDLVAQAAAIRCTRTEGMNDLSDRLLADVAGDKKAAVQKSLDNPPSVSTDLRGDVRMEATWETEADLDLALIDKNGQRLSWLGGGKAPVSFSAPTGLRSESLAFQGLASGSYVVEVSRTVPTDQTPVRGTITLRVVGETRQIPFTLTGTRLELGRVDLSYTSRLVPY